MKKRIIAFSITIFLASGFVSPALADTYIVKKGDTLEEIAAQYNLSVQQLQELNNLTSDHLQINQQLITSTSSLTKAGTTSIDPTQTTTYTVVKGDTLNKIAKKYNLTVTELKKLNPSSSDKLQIGDLLIVSQTTTQAETTTTLDLIETKTYTVIKGDTLSKIAKKHNVTVAKLKKLNPSSSDKLQIGDLLIVSKTTTQVVKEASVKTTIDLTETEIYTVVKGDTLNKIAKKYNLTVAELKKLNPVLSKSDVLTIDQQLTVGQSANDAETSTENQVITEAKKVLGAPYLWTGVSPSGFDSSGFIYYSFKQAGAKTSRYSIATYYNLAKKVTSPKPGDLIFFALGSDKAVANHGGIYLGDNEFIHVTVNKGVTISSLTNSYYKDQLIDYKRLEF